ncbi:MAG: HAMP domain-containing sensor histidine kinase [Pseudomonadota bacterium]
MSAVRHGLRRRVVAACALSTLVTAALFSGLALAFAYTVEDSGLSRQLVQEEELQRKSWNSQRKLATPMRDFVTLHASAATFPADLRRQLRSAVQPGVDARALGPELAAAGNEFFGDEGRHYHVRVIKPGGRHVYLVAEVSGELVVRRRLASLLGFLGWLAAAVLVCTLVLANWLARRATAPLTRLAELVSNAAPGKLPEHFASQFPDNEIGVVARNLERSMQRIADFIEREQHFTRDASHELRTPLAAIEGAAALLSSQPLSPQGADQLQRIRTAAAHMSQTVATLLALAREELHEQAAQQVALLPVIERAIVDFAYLLDGKPVEVVVTVAADARVAGHRTVLAIVVSNLVSNAFSHTMQGEIRLYLEDGNLVIADSGPGIAPGLQARLFEAGVKGEGSSGFGLGLSIARRLGERFGIALSVENGANGGARAVLRFT